MKHPVCTSTPRVWSPIATQLHPSWTLALFLLSIVVFSIGPRISYAACPSGACVCAMSGGCSEYCCAEPEVEELVSDVQNLLQSPPKPPARILQSPAVGVPPFEGTRDEIVISGTSADDALRSLAEQHRDALEHQQLGFERQYRLLEEQYRQRDRDIERALQELEREADRITQERISIADAKALERSDFESRESWFTTGLGGLFLTNLMAILGWILQRPSEDDRLLKKLEIDLRRFQLESVRKGLHSSRWRRRA